MVLFPGIVEVVDPTGASLGTLLVWLKNGYLSALEYAWTSDETPVRLPRLERLRIAAARS